MLDLRKCCPVLNQKQCWLQMPKHHNRKRWQATGHTKFRKDKSFFSKAIKPLLQDGFPRRPRGTSSRSLSAWQATAQLAPLVLAHFGLTFGRRASPSAYRLPCFTPPAKSQSSTTPRPVLMAASDGNFALRLRSQAGLCLRFKTADCRR
jgi:hypothetical protein